MIVGGEPVITLEVENVTKRYVTETASETVLQNISFQVAAGELVSLLGESGCGKSTLLQVIGGFTQPDQGQVRLNGQAKLAPSRDCIMLFQNYGLLPWRTVRKNIELGLEHLPKEERRETAVAYARLVGLEDRLNHFPHQLSGGMQQRTALARALALKPKVILMDEPFAALDTFTRYYLQDELLRIHGQERPTILFVTHDIDEAVYVSDRILIMKAGPGEIHHELEIRSSRPRDRGHSDFQHYRKHILDRFHFSGSRQAEDFTI